MNTKAILGFVVASLIALIAVSSVMALSVTIGTVTINDVDLTNVTGVTTVISGSPGETVPITVRFVANADSQDVKVKATIGDGTSVSTSRFDVLNGSTYVKHFSITLPNVQDIDGSNESWNLKIIVSDRTGNEQPANYNIKMQREAKALSILSIDSPATASAGEIIALDIVLKNTGSRTADDTFVAVSIPELGISKKAYFGDLTATDNTEANDNEDARERRIYLAIPADTITGDYTVEIKASNYDITSTTKKVISITGLAVTNNTSTVTPVTGKTKLPTSVIVLTVVLVIIFVVLLIVLIVLLTKKQPEKVEDYGETSYY